MCGVPSSDKSLFCKIFKNDGETFDKSQDRKSVYMSSMVEVLHSVPLTAGTMPFVLRKEYAVIWLAVNRLETENCCYYHHSEHTYFCYAESYVQYLRNSVCGLLGYTGLCRELMKLVHKS